MGHRGIVFDLAGLSAEIRHPGFLGTRGGKSHVAIGQPFGSSLHSKECVLAFLANPLTIL